MVYGISGIRVRDPCLRFSNSVVVGLRLGVLFSIKK
jgi:hypothetical protein